MTEIISDVLVAFVFYGIVAVFTYAICDRIFRFFER